MLVDDDQVFRALSDPTRRGLYEMLARDGEATVQTLTSHANVSQPMVSRHLAILAQAGLVTHQRRGREHRYRSRPEGLAPIAEWMRHQGAFWAARFDALDDLLDCMDQ